MQNPAPSGAGFSDVTDSGNFFTFPLARRDADALSPLRRQDSARLSDVTDTGDFFTFPLDRRRADTLRAHKQNRAWKLASMHVFYLFLPAAQAWSPCAG